MANVTVVTYMNGAKGLLSGGINWVTDNIKAALVGSGYTPDQDAHDFWDDVSANELGAGGGYTAGGVLLTGKAVNMDAATNKLTISATGPSWTNITGTFKYVVFYKSTGTASDSPLIAYMPLSAARTLAGDNYTVTIGANGIIQATVA